MFDGAGLDEFRLSRIDVWTVVILANKRFKSIEIAPDHHEAELARTARPR